MLLTNCYYSDDAAEREPPRPKPRQRTLGLSATEKIDEDAESQDLSRPQTSSASIPVSFDRSSNVTVRSCSPNMCFNARLFCFFLIIAHVCYVVSSCSGQKEITHPIQARVNNRSTSPSPRLILDPEVITEGSAP